MNKLTHFIKSRKYTAGGLLLFAVAAAYFLFIRNEPSVLNFFTVTKGEVKSEVSVTGKVRSARSLDLAFEKSGRITRIYVSVGNKVNEGQLLVSLDNSDLIAQLSQAQANLKSQEAKFEQLRKGTRPEQIKIHQAQLDKSKQDLANYYSGAINVLNDSYTKADDAVRKQVSGLFFGPNTVNPQLIFSSSDSQAVIDTQSKMVAANTALDSWRKQISVLNASDFLSIEQVLNDSNKYLNVIKSMLDRLMDSLNSAFGTSAATIDSYKLNVNTARSNVNLATTNVGNQSQLISSQKIVVQTNQDQLSLDLAGSTQEDLVYQEAQVESAKANVAYYQSQVSKTILRAPFSGTVTKVNFDPGDIVSANSAVVSFIGFGRYEIEANIGESDIADVKIGDMAVVTLDAYGSDLFFQAKVIQVDLSATVLEGVATYKTTLQFLIEDSKILAGLTANVDILSAKKDNVIYVPTRNITTKDGKKYVKLVKDEKNGIVEEKEITAGLRGSDGRTEVASGLNEGDKIVVD